MRKTQLINVLRIESDGELMHLCQILIAVYFNLDISCDCHWLLEVFGLWLTVVVFTANSRL